MSPYTHKHFGLSKRFISILLVIFFAMPPSDVIASTWKPTALVNTEAFQVIDDSNTTANLVLRFGDAVNKNLTYDRTFSRFLFDASLYVQGNTWATGTLSGSQVVIYGSGSLATRSTAKIGIGTNAPKTKLEVVGILSGTTVYANKSFSGAGLSSCSNGTTSKLLWDNVTGRFSCGTDQTGGGGGFGTGNVITIGNVTYVRKDGDTMTGALIINMKNGVLGTIGLKVLQTLSGAVIHAEKVLSSSGQLIVKQSGSASQGSGALAVRNTTRNGTGAYIASSGSILALDSTAQNHAPSLSPHILFGYQGNFDVNLYRSTSLRLQTDQNFWVVGTASGAIVHGEKTLSSSGTLVWEGSASGKSLYVSGSASFSGPLTFGDAISDAVTVNASTWTFANDTNFVLSGGVNGLSFDTDTLSVDALNDRIGIGNTAPKTKLDVTGTMSGRGLVLNGNANITGNLAVSGSTMTVGNFSTRGTFSGSVIHGEKTVSSSGTLVWEGSASGKSLFVSGSASFSGPLTFGDAISDAITVNASTWTFANDTNFVLSGGVNGLSFDTTTFSVDALNDRIGIGTIAPKTTLSVAGTVSGAQLRANNMTVSGAVVYSSGNTLLQNAKGLSGQVLVSQATAAPKWAVPSGAMVWYLDSTISVGASQGAVVTMPYGFTATSVGLRIKGAPTGAALIVDIKKDGATIFSVKPQIDAAATTGGGSAVFSTTAVPIDAEMTVDVTQVGSTFAGSGLTIMLNGTRKY